MDYKDHEKISEEAVKMLESLLVAYYERPFEESYQFLIKKIKASFLGKSTNIKYRAILIDDLEDLTSITVLRLISINEKSLKQKGERIRDPESLANRITDYVYREWLKAIRKRLGEEFIDENDPEKKSQTIAQPLVNEIQAIRLEIIQKCYDDCVEGLPDEKKAVFRAYYPNAKLTPSELVVARKRLANKVVGITQTQAQSLTPEQAKRVLNNLQSKVNKWRKDQIEGCLKECVEAEEADHPRLNYLSQR
jgi:DNA-directed RNA polymerase specialized sigma24 family protein